MRGREIKVGYVVSQGHVAADAVARFVSESVEINGRFEPRIVPLSNVDVALARLYHNDIDYLVLRAEEKTENGLPDNWGPGVPGSTVAWCEEIPVLYVIAAPRVMDTRQISALIVDDMAASHARESIRDRMGDVRYVRYGCSDADSSARKLREQQGAYMHGTAIVCSPEACESARLHMVTEPFVDDGAEYVRFVAITRGASAGTE